VWGAAHRLPPPGPRRAAALAYLEEREKQYDVRARADLHSSAAASGGGDGSGGAAADAPVVRRALLCAPPASTASARACSGCAHLRHARLR
jgi:hypothetical protein